MDPHGSGRTESAAAHSRRGGAPQQERGARHAGPVHARLRDGRIEVRFLGRFSPEDLDAVKAIPGRQWHPDRRSWAIPATELSLATLRRSFGDRLRMGRELAAAGSVPEARLRPAVASGTPAAGPVSDAVPTVELGDDLPPVIAALRREIRTREYSRKTERAYVGWAQRFFGFLERSGSRPVRPTGFEPDQVRAFLEHLATEKGLAARSRNQAASALSFLLREVLGREEVGDIPRAKGPRRLPLVLSHQEVLRVLRELVGKHFLIAVLLYSAGLRLEECLRLRVKDVDFELRQILVRDGKGRKDRYVPLARRATDLLQAQIRRVAELHEKDRAAGHGWAPLPGALHLKDPSAGYDLGWQFVFPAATLNNDPATGRMGRRTLHPTAVQRQVKAAVRRSGLPKRASCHTFRHSFATEALRTGCDVRTLQHVMGHRDIRTTMIYLHVVEQTGLAVRSPLDRADDADEYEHDPVGRPWSRQEIQWDLAAKQWGRAGAPPERRGD